MQRGFEIPLLLVCRRFLARLHIEVADCSMDVLAALALWAVSHAAVMVLDAHVSSELLPALLAEKFVVGHRLTSSGPFAKKLSRAEAGRSPCVNVRTSFPVGVRQDHHAPRLHFGKVPCRPRG